MKIIPLLKISKSSSIYFDFERKIPFIQNFGGSHTEASGKSYSYLNTFLLSIGLLALTGILGWVWDSFIKVPIIVSLVAFTILGIVAGKLFFRIMVVNSMRNRSYEKINKRVVQAVFKQRQNFIVLNMTLWIFAIGVIMGSLIMLINQKASGKGFLILAISWFVVIVLKSFHPQKGLKAIKILKRQLKEGIFND